MSITLDGNGNSVPPEGGKALADQNVKRLAEVVTQGSSLYGLAPRHVLSYYLDVLESHVEAEKQRRILKAYEKKADDMIRHLSSLE